MEIALLVLGVIIFVVSFILPEGNEKKTDKEIAAQKDEVHKMVEQEIDGMKLRVNEATNDTVEYAVDKAERSLEKVSNEKIMAVNEYAGTVLDEINKNHKEVMFLYDMLKDKQADLTSVVREADAKVKEIENVSHTAQNASEILLRGMSVASVSQKGLTKEQKSVFDDLVIPDAKPVVFRHRDEDDVIPVNNAEVPEHKPKAILRTQSKIAAQFAKDSEAIPADSGAAASVSVSNDRMMMGRQPMAAASVQPSNTAEQNNAAAEAEQAKPKKGIAIDVLSGRVFDEGTPVGQSAGGAVTAADFAALSKGIDLSESQPVLERNVAGSSKVTTQAPANSNDEILNMSRQGMNTVEIARTLGLGVGEVKLVLDLFR